MAQTLLLGLGGTGSRVVNNVAAELRKKRISINDGKICCAVLDTNENDNGKILGSGVGVPVIPTSKPRIIEDYLKMYVNKGVRSWMPESPELLKETMKDGAAQMRTKSRLAFMDIIEDKTIHDLEMEINKLFNNRDSATIRVMIVSSLAGGTGSGMFIQVALWLRQYFAKRRCKITIRGVFILPDVFINTIEDIRTDNTEIQSLYANAYGAIRELNAITKIKTKSYKPRRQIKIGSLFNSDNGEDGLPVFDYAFFIDDISEGGSVLQTITQYEEVAARLIYMQLYAPMHDELYSEEDNLFKRFQMSAEPVFGSCGTSKAVYPKDDILRYCALRASQNSVSTGWRRLDDEIKDKQRREEERENNGVVLRERINPRAEYIHRFDAKINKDTNENGRDKLFFSIAHDICNEEPIPGEEGNVIINYTDKVEDFLATIEELVTAAVDSENPGNLRGIRLSSTWKANNSDTVSSLSDLVKKKANAVERFINETEASVEIMAEDLLDRILPADMGDINQENLNSIFGFLTKKDNNNETYFVHPIAVRYLLYKLAASLEEIKSSIILETARRNASQGYGDGKPKIDFDNPKTKKVETDALDYLKSKKSLQSEEKFLAVFKELYAQHNAGQAELCRKFAVLALKYRLAVILSQRLEKLIVGVEDFFKNLTKVSNTLEEAIAENIRKNSQVSQKTLYICASAEDKESLYSSLGFNFDKSNTDVNKVIVNALYGQFCVKENPNAENNRAYKDKSVEKTFYTEVIRAYSKLILESNSGDIDLDIYSAICRASDIEYEKAKANEYVPQSDRLEDINIETGETNDNEDAKHIRRIRKMREIAERLKDLGAPFLISDDEVPEDADEHLIDEEEAENEVFTPIKKRKTFWGFSPVVAEKCPELGTILGVNVQSQQNAAYEKNELNCYRAVYGIQAGYVEKFNELRNGDYYTNYMQVVRRMNACAEAGNEKELIHTPHIDKTWHQFLPYVTPEMQQQEEGKFYRCFMLALAYGMITVDNNGKYQVKRMKKAPDGSIFEVSELVKYDARTINVTDVIYLIEALKVDGAFMLEAAKLEKKFQEECETVSSYENTEFLRGRLSKAIRSRSAGTAVASGIASELDTNAVTIIVRYHNSTKSSPEVSFMLRKAIENLCCDMVKNNYRIDDNEGISLAGYRLCNRIFKASALTEKNIETFEPWFNAWSLDNSITEE